jgi:hypothetical protein
LTNLKLSTIFVIVGLADPACGSFFARGRLEGVSSVLLHKFPYNNSLSNLMFSHLVLPFFKKLRKFSEIACLRPADKNKNYLLGCRLAKKPHFHYLFLKILRLNPTLIT